MEHVDHILIVDDDREIRELVGNYLKKNGLRTTCLLYTSPSPRDATLSRMPSSA